MFRIRPLIALLALVFVLSAPGAHAEIAGNTITIGVLTDMNGGNADATGQGSVAAAQLAVEDARTILPGVTVNIVSADHQNKADIASGIARDWIANKAVNVITDVPFSSAGLAVSEATRNAPRTIFIDSSSGTSDLTGTACSPNTVQWTYDTYALGNVLARAMTIHGLRTWFFITADYAFGAALERDTAGKVRLFGGSVLGGVKNPAFTTDYSSYLLAARNSPAQVIGIANKSIDFINIIKQAHEFGLTGKGDKQLAALMVLITDVESIGLDTAAGLYLASPFYWDLNDRTRAFSARFAERLNGRKPTMLQAGVYSGLVHYFEAVRQAKSVDATAVTAAMRDLPADDDALGKGSLRIDGRALHDFYLFQVKSPAESKGAWDDYRLIAKVEAEDAARPLSEDGCPLVK